MPTSQDVADFIEAAPGQSFNPDGAYGLQCKDLIDAYAIYLWGNWRNTIRPGNANQCWRGHNPTHFEAIPNIAGDLTNFPRYGDVVIWNGDGINPYGHIAIVRWADAYSMQVLQMNVGGTANRPAEIGWLKYDQPGTGPVIGWLRPRVSDAKPLTPNERWTNDWNVNRRATPRVADDSNIIDQLPAKSRQVWTGYVHGDAVDGEDRWYKDDVGYAHFSGFSPVTADGLPDQTPRPAPDKPLAPNERIAGPDGVNQRLLPKVAEDSPVIRAIPGGAREVWEGYVIGENYTSRDGVTSNIWLKDKDGYALLMFFDPATTDGLPNLTPAPAPVPAPTPDPTPNPTPDPVPAPVTELDGIDVSNYQSGPMDLKAMGAKVVIIRASEGGDGKPDPMLETHVKRAREAGCRVEYYHYSHIGHSDGNTPEWEAECFLKIIAPHFQPGDVVNLDWECNRGCDLSRADLADRWMAIVSAKLKCKVRFYTYLNVLKVHVGSFALLRERRWHLWLAAYPTAMANQGFNRNSPRPDVPGWTVDMWQYSSTGKLPGYAGDLDLNVMYLTVDPVPGPEPEPAPDVAAKLAAIREHAQRISALTEF